MSVRAPVVAAIIAENTFSAQTSGDNGGASLYIDGTFVATVVLQGRPASSAAGAWVDLGSATAPGVVASAVLPGGWSYRAGVKTGGFTSGTANLILQASNQEGGG